MRALTIAGSDSGGGAGIQADLKTFHAFGVFGMSAITAITAQNTIGVQAVHELPIEIIIEQIKSIATDIGVDAVKTGMLATPEIVNAVADQIKTFQLKNLVVDPVMIAKSGDSLLSESARKAVKDNLLPLATVMTPNLYEAEVLLDRKIKTLSDMKEAAVQLAETGCPWVVIKGGHLEDNQDAIDIVYDGSSYHLLESPRFETKNTHGTGCTFSSAIAASLAKGRSPIEAITIAKKFISRAIETSLNIGQGHGPTNHNVDVKSPW